MTRRAQRLTSLAVAALAALATACGSDDDKSCDVAKQTGCSTGLVCELVDGGRPVCAQPLVLSGSVFDLETVRAGREGARRRPRREPLAGQHRRHHRRGGRVPDPGLEPPHEGRRARPARRLPPRGRAGVRDLPLRHPAGAADQHGGRGPRRGRARGRGSADHRHRPPRAPLRRHRGDLRDRHGPGEPAGRARRGRAGRVQRPRRSQRRLRDLQPRARELLGHGLRARRSPRREVGHRPRRCGHRRRPRHDLRRRRDGQRQREPREPRRGHGDLGDPRRRVHVRPGLPARRDAARPARSRAWHRAGS